MTTARAKLAHLAVPVHVDMTNFTELPALLFDIVSNLLVPVWCGLPVNTAANLDLFSHNYEAMRREVIKRF